MQRDYIQFNPKHYLQALVFDIDRALAFEAWEDANLPRPSFITLSSKGNGHAHLVYVFKTPIATHDHARFQPMRWAAAIQRGFSRRLGADMGYAGLLTKNPLTHDTIDYGVVYELAQLDAFLDFEDKAPSRNEASQGLGRNVEMFDSLRFKAYSSVQGFETCADFESWCLTRCAQINDAFASPLPDCEPRATARSVAKWTWVNRGNLKGREVWNRGVMAARMDENMDLQQRQIAAAAYTNNMQKERTRIAIQQAYELAKNLGKKPTQKAIAAHTGLGIATVKRHWKNIKKS